MFCAKQRYTAKVITSYVKQLDKYKLTTGSKPMAVLRGTRGGTPPCEKSAPPVAPQ